LGRSTVLPISAGSVCDRCIGARLLRFVTLAGNSCGTGEGDFSRGCRDGAVLRCAIGDDDNKSTTL
jgi:hypothetical protein